MTPEGAQSGVVPGRGQNPVVRDKPGTRFRGFLKFKLLKRLSKNGSGGGT